MDIRMAIFNPPLERSLLERYRMQLAEERKPITYDVTCSACNCGQICRTGECADCIEERIKELERNE